MKSVPLFYTPSGQKTTGFAGMFQDFKAVSEQEKSDIEERMENTEMAIDKLIGYLSGRYRCFLQNLGQ